MRTRAHGLFAGALLAVAAVASAAPERSSSGVTVAKLVWGEQAVERLGAETSSWRRVQQGDAMRTGDHIRTAPAGVARLDFPWMAVTLGPSSELSVPASAVLSTVLERGRAEFAGEGRDIVKIEVGQAEIRGGGRLVLWREGARTAATALQGAFRVTAAGQVVEIRAGEGTAVGDGQVPAPPTALPAPPLDLVPGQDPGYVPAGQPAELHWSGEGPHFVEVLALQTDDVLLARAVDAPPVRIPIPWLGTFRWRVSTRAASGLESPPSPPGYLCVVDR